MVDLKNRTLFELSIFLEEGSVTSVDIVQYYLEQIEAYNGEPYCLNALRTLNADIITEALALDRERKISGPRSPIHGLPILIKDNIDTSNMPTTAGSVALATNQPDKDAFLVHELRRHGALILGKTNLSEFAHFKSTNEPSGFSSLGGQVRNPFDPDLSPSGSSSGSAVAMAADFGAGAVGTETNGSIMMPAKMNQIVGLKPTVGLISRSGIIPISQSQDTAGPMAKSILDAALLLDGMAGIDSDDPMTNKQIRPEKSYFELAQETVPETVIAQYNEPANPLNTAVTQQAAEILVTQGHQMASVKINPAILDEMKDDSIFMKVMLAEFQVGMNAYLQGHDTAIQDLHALVDYNETRKSVKFGQDILEKAANLPNDLNDPTYMEALSAARRISRDEGLEAMFAEANSDVLLTAETSAMSLAAVAGFPSLSIPMGFQNEQPTCVFLIGRPYTEAKILALGQLIEAAMPNRVVPFE